MHPSVRLSCLLPAALLAACDGGPGSSAADPVVLPAFACGERATALHDLQGAGPRSRFEGVVVDAEGVVTANLQTGLGGFFLQAPDAEHDADPTTSEAVFVRTGEPRREIKPGLRVRVRASVEDGADERGGLTTLTAVSELATCGSAPLPAVVVVTEPPPDWERYEGMRLELPGPLTVTGNHELLRFGRVDVSLAGRLYVPTERFPPGPEARELAAANARAALTLDDNRESENPSRIWWLRQPVANPRPWRVGSTLSGVQGVLDERDGRHRLQLGEAPAEVVQAARPEQPPEVAGALRVVSFNLLNWFNGDGRGGGFPTPRGADDATEAARQRDKLVAALAALRPDVAALMEVENDGYAADAALPQLVDALNRALGRDGDYRWVDPGVPRLGGDEITVALVYRAGRVSAVGAPARLDSGAFATLNRVPLAQAFEPAGGGARFTVVANHWKSKGGCEDAQGADVDRGDGQGCWNARRVDAARELSDWLAGDPTGSGSPDVLVTGDLNSHGEEDPIRLLRQRGYVDVLAQHAGRDAYSFVFGGRSGRLDHALASPSLALRIAGAAEWHANADELTVFDYATAYKSPKRRALYRADPFRASDHDPLIVGIDPPAPTD